MHQDRNSQTLVGLKMPVADSGKQVGPIWVEMIGLIHILYGLELIL